ncbi:hypothetical protein FACS189431_8680 [Alphaproteobacteria bacterium]|nr:hypothetical protein FACS189431_8680 [Alphaproteobacteria bacterium]
MAVIIAVPFFTSCIVATTITLAANGVEAYAPLATAPPHIWLMLGYLAIVISVITHIISTKVYEKLGTATTAGLDYIYYIAAPIVPMLLIGETCHGKSRLARR